MASTTSDTSILSSTYRLQLHKQFTFADAAEIAPYLSRLGVSHLYSSPYLQAARDSKHGYDVVDPTRVNEELGGAEAHQSLCRRLGESGLGQILDFVPNHMCVSEQSNAWWRDILELGPYSKYASYFDVNWESRESLNHNRVLLPVLEDHYGKLLETGKLKLDRTEDGFVVRYRTDSYPVSPETWSGILRYAAQLSEIDELDYYADAFDNVSTALRHSSQNVNKCRRDLTVLRRQLSLLLKSSTEASSAIDSSLAKVASEVDTFDRLLSGQYYRLAHWKTAGEEIDYRRFFDITGLASLRIEDAQVFDDVHSLVVAWVRQGVIDGLRIDHVDGLRDPYGYLSRLRERTPRAWIFVEKILAADEALPGNWPVQGTTGYEFMNVAIGVLVYDSAEAAFSELYHAVTNDNTPWPVLLAEKKRLVLRSLFSSEFHHLQDTFMALCRASRRFRDYTRREVGEMVQEMLARISVYRTYIRAEDEHISEEDERRITAAIEAASADKPEGDKDLWSLLKDVLLRKYRGEEATEFLMRLQQLSGPVMAKGAEDTAFYCYNRLIALNEVGGDPGLFGRSAKAFHDYCRKVQAAYPSTILATTTHDTKRGEDVRARIAALSEIADEWRNFVNTVLALLKDKRPALDIDAHSIYFLLQTVVGAWPIEVERVQSYMLKATREAKVRTSWTAPNKDFENQLTQWVDAIYEEEDIRRLVTSLADRIRYAGCVNSLTQVLWKCTAPGVPDVYQGQELWDNSLVDPDNRRPVDYELRKRLLEAAEQAALTEIVERWQEGLPKLLVLQKALHLRKAMPDAFGPESTYEALATTGSHAQHVIAFQRNMQIAVVTQRWTLIRNGTWNDTAVALPPGRWKNLFIGDVAEGATPVAGLLDAFPVALLVRTNSQDG